MMDGGKTQPVIASIFNMHVASHKTRRSIGAFRATPNVGILHQRGDNHYHKIRDT